MNSYIPSKNLSDFDFALPSGSIHNKLVMDDTLRYSYATKFEQENYSISADHCYARPWNWKADNSFLRPTKILFIDKPLLGIRKSSNPLVCFQDSVEIIDIESEPDISNILYDVDKARNLMDECQQYVLNSRPDRNEEEWEEKISK